MTLADNCLTNIWVTCSLVINWPITDIISPRLLYDREPAIQEVNFIFY